MFTVGADTIGLGNTYVVENVCPSESAIFKFIADVPIVGSFQTQLQTPLEMDNVDIVVSIPPISERSVADIDFVNVTPSKTFGSNVSKSVHTPLMSIGFAVE